ncbi:pentapeptide repeat-containing protein [Actinokineospora sp. 24-640]
MKQLRRPSHPVRRSTSRRLRLAAPTMSRWRRLTGRLGRGGRWLWSAASAVAATGAVVAGVVISNQNTTQSADQARVQAELARQAQDSDRFTKALGDLGAADPPARTSGISQLEQLMRDRPGYQPVVIERLTEFIRYRAPRSAPQCQEAFDPVYKTDPPVDIQLAITVLGRRDPAADQKKPIELGFTCLRYVTFVRPGAEMAKPTAFEGADFSQADLSGAYFDLVNLRDASFANAKIVSAYFIGADLTNATFQNATLTNCHLGNAKTEGTRFDGADTTGSLIDE